MKTETSPAIYDLLIIGGGIAGAGLARHASLQGASTALFEKRYFGNGASHASSKLIHGGIRYLETSWDRLRKGDWISAQKNFRFVFTSLKECRRLEKIAPQLIKIIPITIPIYRSSKRSISTIYMGCLLYWFLGLLGGQSKFPKIYSNPQSILKQMPALKKDGLVGAITIYERLTDDIELVRKTLTSASKHGAHLFENTQVTGWKYDKTSRLYQVDTLNAVQKTHTYQARQIVNASGAWIDEVRSINHSAHQRKLIEPIAGCHIHIKPFMTQSMLLEAEDGRLFFCIHRGDHLRVGTTEVRCETPDHVLASSSEISYLLNALNTYFPNQHFDERSILHTDAGIRPLAVPKDSTSADRISREHQIIADDDGTLNLVGVKLTDHRRAAEQCFQLIRKPLKQSGCALKNIRSYKVKL